MFAHLGQLVSSEGNRNVAERLSFPFFRCSSSRGVCLLNVMMESMSPFPMFAYMCPKSNRISFQTMSVKLFGLSGNKAEQQERNTEEVGLATERMERNCRIKVFDVILQIIQNNLRL